MQKIILFMYESFRTVYTWNVSKTCSTHPDIVTDARRRPQHHFMTLTYLLCCISWTCLSSLLSLLICVITIVLLTGLLILIIWWIRVFIKDVVHFHLNLFLSQETWRSWFVLAWCKSSKTHASIWHLIRITFLL